MIQVRSLMLHSEDLANPACLEMHAELLGNPHAPAQLERLEQSPRCMRPTTALT
ncbi:hypothetical protein [Pseudomonas sp. NBRC 111124]|uniref:hypothetical protein n=1 Tax=Pseudomonas sp. NBRC 111124 TaxID=1661039 RepID=UPI0012E2AFAE